MAYRFVQKQAYQLWVKNRYMCSRRRHGCSDSFRSELRNLTCKGVPVTIFYELVPCALRSLLRNALHRTICFCNARLAEPTSCDICLNLRPFRGCEHSNITQKPQT